MRKLKQLTVFVFYVADNNFNSLYFSCLFSKQIQVENYSKLIIEVKKLLEELYVNL